MNFNIVRKILLPLVISENHRYYLQLKQLQTDDCIEILVIDCFNRVIPRFFLVIKAELGIPKNVELNILDRLADFCSKDGYSLKAINSLRYCEMYISDIQLTTDYVPIAYCNELFVQESEQYYRWLMLGGDIDVSA